jgi:rod shape determining protein RodA
MSRSGGPLGSLRRFVDSVDRPAMLAILGLLVVSLVTLYSVTHAPVPEDGDKSLVVGRGIFWRQIVWIVIGMMTLMAGFSLPFRILEDSAWLQYGLSMVLLVLVLSMPHRFGAERWIIVGPLQFQPSEPAKAVLIFVLARHLASLRGDVNALRHLVVPFLIVLPPVALILKQPDLGTGLVLLAILVPMLFWAGLQPLHLLLLASPAFSIFIHLYYRTKGGDPLWIWLVLVLSIFGVTLWRRRYLLENIVILGVNISMRFVESAVWSRMHEYQQKRISTFFSPDLDKLGQGYHVAQSKIAVGSGGLLGKGFMQGTQKELAFLPARHTDFIFSVIGEEFGFLGALVVLALFTVLVARGIGFASRARNGFARFAAFGIVAYICFQVAQNIGMTVGLFPVAGIPLPLVSYGGSSLAMTMFLLGVLLNLGKSWREY